MKYTLPNVDFIMIEESKRVETRPGVSSHCKIDILQNYNGLDLGKFKFDNY